MNSKQLAQEWFQEVWNRKNVAAIDEMTCASAAGDCESCTVTTPEDFKKKVYEPFITAFPDVQVIIDGVVAETDEVVTRWTAKATHTGPLGVLEPTGKRVQFSGMTWQKLQEGKIVAASDSYNFHGLLAFLTTGEESASVRKW